MKFYNTLTKKIEEFIPLKDNEINMYVCGPTVYNYFHIGNSRVFIVFDTLRNYFKYKGYKVKYVQNITDIDDKIIKKAQEQNVLWSEISKKYTEAYFEDIKKLKIDLPDINPKATDEISEMIKMIDTLLKKGYAYITKNGVYYDVSKFNEYGKLSHQKKEELIEGIRVGVDEEKRHALDFALWKFSKEGEPFWDSPWGKGRPGWHIECSAMSTKYLGEIFDIHGGGVDLIFPHHENEIAQSEGCTGKILARYWLHVGYMNIEGEKMSKSKGNFIFVRDILKEFEPEVIRLFILSAHYRGPLDFSYEKLKALREGYKEIYYTFQRLNQRLENYNNKNMDTSHNEFLKRFKESLDNDFNTPSAIAEIFKCIKKIKRIILTDNVDKITENAIALKIMCDILKITPEVKTIDKDILDLIKKRESLRKEKKYDEADNIKNEIIKKGYLIEDTRIKTFIIKEL